jgi:hypothetical protein
MIKIALPHNMKSVVIGAIIGAIVVFGVSAILPSSQATSIPKMSALEAVSKVTEYCKQKENADYYADYIITSIVYGSPDQLDYGPSQGGSWSVDNNDNEASWFITLTNRQKADIMVLRVMNDGTIEGLSHFQT